MACISPLTLLLISQEVVILESGAVHQSEVNPWAVAVIHQVLVVSLVVEVEDFQVQVEGVKNLKLRLELTLIKEVVVEEEVIAVNSVMTKEEVEED